MRAASKTEERTARSTKMEDFTMAKYRKLGRTSSQRKALLRGQVTSLLYNGKIVTTEARAKEVIDGKRVTIFDEVEKTIKKDKPSRLHARREILKVLYPVKYVPKEIPGRKKNTKQIDLVAKLFDEIAPKYADRNGGYTRIVKIGQRKGDGALEVLLELV